MVDEFKTKIFVAHHFSVRSLERNRCFMDEMVHNKFYVGVIVMRFTGYWLHVAT